MPAIATKRSARLMMNSR